jgi:hypothetical protein
VGPETEHAEPFTRRSELEGPHGADFA